MKKYLGFVLVAAFVLLGAVHFVSAENNLDEGMRHKKEVHDSGSTLEVHFFDSGKVLVRGAKVTSISGNTVNAFTAWGSVNLNWAVNVDPNGSKVVRKFGGVASVSEIAVGDLISFHGDLVTTTASPLTVNAKTVKDWSIQKKLSGVNGTVKSVDPALMSFVLTNGERGDVTVLVTSSTKISKGEDGTAATFADVTVGARVGARGVWNTLSSQLTASEVRIKQPEAGNDNH